MGMLSSLTPALCFAIQKRFFVTYQIARHADFKAASNDEIIHSIMSYLPHSISLCSLWLPKVQRTHPQRLFVPGITTEGEAAKAT